MFQKNSIDSLTDWASDTHVKSVHRRKRTKISPIKNDKSDFEISLQNKYQILNKDDIEMQMDEQSSESESENLNNNDKKEKVPAIVVYSFLNKHKETLDNLQKQLMEELEIRSKKDRLIIKTKNLNDYKKVLDFVVKSEVQYHTYTLNSEKIVRLVLRGVAINVTEIEIQEDLKSMNFEIIKVKQLSKKVLKEDGSLSEYKLPLYIVDFKPESNIHDIYKVRKICYYKVYWERYKNNNSVIQCYNCQDFGHVAKNCHRIPRCVICAGEHKLENCTFKNKENNDKIQCANCKQKHTASFKQCPVLLKVQNSREQRPRNINRVIHVDNNNNRQQQLHTTYRTNRYMNTYSEVVKQGRREGTSINNKINAEENNVSFGSIFKEIKDLFVNINFNKIISVFKKTMIKIKNNNDNFSKVFCLVEAVIEIFDEP